MNPVAAVLERARLLETDQRARVLGDEEIIPRCIEIVGIIEEYPDLRLEFVEAFKVMWGRPEYGWETIMFCMRVLRWEEIQDFFREIHAQAVAAEDHRAESCARGILDAYEAHWDGAEEEPYRQLDAHRQPAREQVGSSNGG